MVQSYEYAYCTQGRQLSGGEVVMVGVDDIMQEFNVQISYAWSYCVACQLVHLPDWLDNVMCK